MIQKYPKKILYTPYIISLCNTEEFDKLYKLGIIDTKLVKKSFKFACKSLNKVVIEHLYSKYSNDITYEYFIHRIEKAFEHEHKQLIKILIDITEKDDFSEEVRSDIEDILLSYIKNDYKESIKLLCEIGYINNGFFNSKHIKFLISNCSLNTIKYIYSLVYINFKPWYHLAIKYNKYSLFEWMIYKDYEKRKMIEINNINLKVLFDIMTDK